jgi:hypothetical protein
LKHLPHLLQRHGRVCTMDTVGAPPRSRCSVDTAGVVQDDVGRHDLVTHDAGLRAGRAASAGSAAVPGRFAPIDERHSKRARGRPTLRRGSKPGSSDHTSCSVKPRTLGLSKTSDRPIRVSVNQLLAPAYERLTDTRDGYFMLTHLQLEVLAEFPFLVEEELSRSAKRGSALFGRWNDGELV